MNNEIENFGIAFPNVKEFLINDGYELMCDNQINHCNKYYYVKYIKMPHITFYVHLFCYRDYKSNPMEVPGFLMHAKIGIHKEKLTLHGGDYYIAENLIELAPYTSFDKIESIKHNKILNKEAQQQAIYTMLVLHERIINNLIWFDQVIEYAGADVSTNIVIENAFRNTFTENVRDLLDDKHKMYENVYTQKVKELKQ